MKTNEFKTEQEHFWAGQFGTDYINRNSGARFVASNLHLYSKIFSNKEAPKSIIEFGANIGLNIEALKLLFPDANISGIEINETAATVLAERIGKDKVFNQSIYDFVATQQYDLTLIKGVLIHINPDMLPQVYEKLYQTSKRYILVCEYYNPTPVTISYRGHEDRLFKRDFAGEMLNKYKDLKLVDYGFSYHKDNSFPQDDLTWFLMAKTNG